MSLGINQDNLEELSPENIASLLFTKEPKDPCSIQIISEQQYNDVTFIFEILLIIMMEGLEILTGDLSKAQLNDLSQDHILSLNPWFESLGFTLKVNILTKDEKDKYSKYYCRIIIRDKLQEIFFEIKNLKKNYHFYLNGDHLVENRNQKNLNNLYCVFINSNLTFKIWFDFNYPSKPLNKII